MRTTFLMVGLLVMSCGVNEAEGLEGDDLVSSADSELGTSARSYVVARKDRRQCLLPGCGGWFVHDVNRATLKEVYVDWFDFSEADVATDYQDAALNAADGDVVFYGRLAPRERGVVRFMVTSAWRGLPGTTERTGDVFFTMVDSGIRCITTPCPSLSATKLHSSAKLQVHDFDLTRASLPLVDQNWLAGRVISNGGLVAGALVTRGAEKVLDVSKVFLKLPASHQSCGRPAVPFCGKGTVNVWTRDENLCSVPAGCAKTGTTFCAQYVPSCAEGYTLVQWTGVSTCSAYACDPSFLNP